MLAVPLTLVGGIVAMSLTAYRMGRTRPFDWALPGMLMLVWITGALFGAAVAS